MTQCDRCEPDRLCLVHEGLARSLQYQRNRDAREAEARGKARYERNSKEVRGWL